jgi:hypothetical protein
MEIHWDDVVDAVDLLTYILKRYDNNGIDLRFTISNTKCNAKTSTDLTNTVRRKQPPRLDGNADHKLYRISNMGNQLQLVTQEYRTNLENGYTERRSFPGLAPRLEPVKPAIVFILTDGRWQPESCVDTPIATLVDALVHKGSPPNQFGVQFIQFGNDSIGTNRLKYLDNIEGLEL